GEPLAAPVHLQQVALLERLHLEIPENLGYEATIADQGEAVGVLGLVPGQARRRLDDPVQCRAILGQLAGLRRDRARDRFELVAARQVVVEHEELLLQFDRDLHDRRKNDDERAVLFAGGKLGVESLNDLDAAQEPVEAAQNQNRGAVS